MEVRCGNCSKLFRVSDDKITGSGIKFACSKCGEYVKITLEDFEHYNLSQATMSALASFAPKPKPAPVSPAPTQEEVSPASSASFDLSEPFAEEVAHEDEAPPEFVQPMSPEEPAISPAPVEPRTKPPEAPKDKPEAKATPKPAAPIAKPEATPLPVAPSIPAPAPIMTSETTLASARPASSRRGKKLLVFFAVLLLLVTAAVFGARWYLMRSSQQVSDAFKAVTMPEGLQITNASGAIDAVKGDLVMTGTVENTTDKPRPAWYIVADIYDAQNTVIFRAKMLNGKQVYTRRDYDIMAKRGVNLQEFKKNYLLQQGTVIPPRGTMNFEIRVMEPPVGIASFNATLQPFDPVQLFKEMAEDQKQK